jgi:multidrug efflux pump
VHPDLRKRKEPNLPTDVNQYGLTIRKSTGLAMILISLYSPNRTYDSLFLANSATINVNDALYRVPGVGEVRVFGARLQRVNLEW